MKKVFVKSALCIVMSLLSFSLFAMCSCTMTNAKGQTWVGTGATRAMAAMNAQKFCARHSVKVMNCKNVGCSCH